MCFTVGTSRNPGTVIKREYKRRDGKCDVTVSFIVRDDPCWTRPASTVQDTAVNAPEDPQPTVSANTASVIEQVSELTSSVSPSQTQMVESAEELQGIPVSTSSPVDVREGVAQAITVPDHTFGVTGAVCIQTSQPVTSTNSEYVSIENIQEGSHPDTKHDTAGVTKDQQPTALSDIVQLEEAAADAEKIQSIRDRLGNSVDYLEGVMNLGDFISEVSSGSAEMSIGMLSFDFRSSTPP